ncbi:hypothetical protein ABK040_016782 [Willaertia magna]
MLKCKGDLNDKSREKTKKFKNLGNEFRGKAEKFVKKNSSTIYNFSSTSNEGIEAKFAAQEIKMGKIEGKITLVKREVKNLTKRIGLVEESIKDIIRMLKEDREEI